MAELPIPESTDEPDTGAEILAFPGARRDPRLRDVIGEVLREERHDQNRTLTDVAADAAVSIQYLSEVERGRKDVSSDVLHAIHGALGLELDELLDRVVHRIAPGSQRRGPSMLAA